MSGITPGVSRAVTLSASITYDICTCNSSNEFTHLVSYTAPSLLLLGGGGLPTGSPTLLLTYSCWEVMGYPPGLLHSILLEHPYTVYYLIYAFAGEIKIIYSFIIQQWPDPIGKVPGATLVYWCDNGSFKISRYFACFRRSFIQQLERAG